MNILSIAVIGAGLAFSTIASAVEVCGELANAYGPFDYRTSHKELVPVEQHHFTPTVENLRGGVSGPLGGELDYTLRASPNHHRALMSLVNWMQIKRNDHIPGATYTITCYFDRALRFTPDDGVVHMLYGNLLYKTGHKKEALDELEVATKYAGDNANLHYNLGLLYFDFQQYDKALEHAQKAYAMGFDLPGLKHKLVAAGKWRDVPPEQAAAPAATSTSARQN